jgi:general secretion pathway protein G
MRCFSQINKKAFSLIELVLVIIVLGILFTIGALFMNDSIDSHRFRATVKEMSEIKKALIGDETIVSAYERTDFGYVGRTGNFPATGSFNLLNTEFATNPHFAEDAWNNAYQYTNGATVILESYGADGANGGTGLSSDIVLRFTRELYINNSAYVAVHDARGNILRGNDSGDANYHITQVQLISNDSAGTFTQATPTNGSMFVLTGIPIGHFSIAVTVQNTNNYRALLNNGNATFSQDVAIYPKGPNRMQIITVRLPGSLR